LTLATFIYTKHGQNANDKMTVNDYIFYITSYIEKYSNKLCRVVDPSKKGPDAIVRYMISYYR